MEPEALCACEQWNLNYRHLDMSYSNNYGAAGVSAAPGCTPCTNRHWFPGLSQSSQLVPTEVTQGADLRQGDCLSLLTPSLRLRLIPSGEIR